MSDYSVVMSFLGQQIINPELLAGSASIGSSPNVKISPSGAGTTTGDDNWGNINTTPTTMESKSYKTTESVPGSLDQPA